MSSAIVTGATGILGRHIVRQLGNDSQKWGKIHAVSRSKKEDFPSTVQHTQINLLGSAEQIAQSLAGIEAEYVFFSAYLQKGSEKENWDVNGDMLDNFLRALEKAGIAKKLKRVVLVTGGKQYGVHLGTVKSPMLETDKWLRDEPFPPNFYYRQQDILHAFCERNENVSWVVTYPNDVIGFALGNFMNIATSLALYAAVSKELSEDLAFPGSESMYTGFDSFVDAALHAEFCEWAALDSSTGNQAFNVINGDIESWQNLWPLVAKHFGMKVADNQFSGPAPLSSETPLKTPPISIYEAEQGLQGRSKPGKLSHRVDLVKWSKQDKVREAWDRLAAREGLEKEALEKATWDFLNLVLGREYDIVASMSKARKLGWTGYRDTWDSLKNVFAELEDNNILPRTH